MAMRVSSTERCRRNLMADYDIEAEALAAVAAAISAHGSAYADSLILVQVGPRGGLTRLAAGRELAERALATPSAKPTPFRLKAADQAGSLRRGLDPGGRVSRADLTPTFPTGRAVVGCLWWV